MTRGCDPADVDMVELFPNGNDYTDVFREHPIPKRTPDEVIEMLGASKRGARSKADGGTGGTDASDEESAG